MEWGGDKSREWLGAFLLALVEGEGIIAPLQVTSSGQKVDICIYLLYTEALNL